MADFDVQGARKEGYSDDDILKHLTSTRKFDVDGALKEGYQKSEIIDHLAKMQPTTGTPQLNTNIPIPGSPIDSTVLHGLASGALSYLRGASQLAHRVIPAIPELPPEYATAPDTPVGKIAHVAGSLAVPIPLGPEIKGAGWGLKALRAAVQGGTAAALQPVEDGKPEDFWKNKAAQATTGAVVGPMVAGAANVIGKGTAKLINAREAGGIPQEAADVMAAGKQHGVRLTYGDISRNPSVQKAEVTMESLPLVGMSGERAAQQTEAKAAATNLAESRYQKFLNTDPGMIHDIEGAAQGGDVRAKNLLEQLKNAGTDPDRVLQTSIGLGDFRTRQEAEHLYDQVESLVKAHNLPDVPMENTATAVSKALQEAQASKLPDRQLIGILSDIKSGISPRAASKPANPFPAGTVAAQQFEQQAAKSIPAQNDYQAIRQLRSDLGNKIQMYMSGENAIIGEKGVGQLQSVKNAIENDLTNFTDNSGVPEVQQAAKTADQYYKTARVPYKDQMLAAAATDKEPDQIFQRFIQQGKGDRAERFYNALDPKGQEAVRYKIVANAVDKATNDATGTFSPQKYFSAMNKVRDASRVFYPGHGEEEIDGFSNLMAHVTRAGQYAENPPTGQRLASGLVTAGTILNPAMAARVGSVAFLTKTLFTTDAGKAFLLASSKLQPGSPQMASLVEKMVNNLPSAAAKVATMPSQETPAPEQPTGRPVAESNPVQTPPGLTPPGAAGKQAFQGARERQQQQAEENKRKLIGQGMPQ